MTTAVNLLLQKQITLIPVYNSKAVCSCREKVNSRILIIICGDTGNNTRPSSVAKRKYQIHSLTYTNNNKLQTCKYCYCFPTDQNNLNNIKKNYR